MKVHKIAFVLLIIGGLNWGLEAFGLGIGNFVSPTIAMIVYILVGASAIYEIFGHKNMCKECSAPASPTM